MAKRHIEVIGAAIGWGAQLHDAQFGPEFLVSFGLFPKQWGRIISPPIPFIAGKKLEYTQRLSQITQFNQELKLQVAESLKKDRFPVVVGGDHSCAIGTWSAISDAYKGEFGLIWIDAHMDSHTPQTTPSHAIHGMPLSALLGFGEASLVGLSACPPALQPQRVALIGVRSFEEGEARLLKENNVRVFSMDEVKARGFKDVLADAVAHVTKDANAYGISLDLDAFDPTVAPGVGSPAPDGLMADEVCDAFTGISDDPSLRALEIAEFNPTRDKENITARLIERVVNSLCDENPTHRWIAAQSERCANNYHPIPVVLSRGEGVWVWDIEGRKYLDMMSAYSAVSFGHSHPRLVVALCEQAKQLAVTSRAFHSDTLKPFLERLCEISGMDMALPVNTGVEAVETAIKAARKWGYEVKGIPDGKAEIIVASGNFHGRTTTVVGFSSEPSYKKHFGPLTPGFKEIPFGDVEALKKAITPNACAFLVEPIQGEAGIIIPPKGWLKACEKLCNDNNVLLILDEVQTGLGRTGALFAFEHEQVSPDGLILGKALGGGLLPVSAFLARREVMQVFTPGTHGSTFGGNPLAAKVALEALNVLEQEDLVAKSAVLGEVLLGGLKSIDSPLIKEVRGKGLWVAIEIDATRASAREICERLMQRGILTKDTHETVIRFAPPLTIDRGTLDWAIEIIRKTLLEF